jgi:hypothetical protein
VLRLYQIAPDFVTRHGGTGVTTVLRSVILLADRRSALDDSIDTHGQPPHDRIAGAAAEVPGVLARSAAITSMVVTWPLIA